MSPRKSLRELLELNPDLNIAHEDYNINVTANYGDQKKASDALPVLKAFDGTDLPAHLYFHVPLCNYICHFCNYVKKLLPRNKDQGAILDEWADLLIEESRRHLLQFPWTRRARIESLYLGGGTAALFKQRQLEKIIRHIRASYSLTSECEISLEGNPDNFTESSLSEALALGFNRFSLGVQSLQDRVNQFVGRGHDSQMSLHAIENLFQTRKPFNVDMMFGLPHQTIETVRRDFEILTRMKVPTITIYRLRNADREQMGIGNKSAWNNTSLRSKMQGEGLFPSLEQTYEMREAIVNILSSAGYSPSPCGWWSLPQTYGEGNIPHVSKNKWEKQDTMIAFGPGAYGWLTGDASNTIQTHNISDIRSYADALKSTSDLPLASIRHLDKEQSVAMRLGFGFKANQPIRLADFKKRFDVNLLDDEPYKTALTHLIERGFLTLNSKSQVLQPTQDGESLHEEIISKLIHQQIGGLCESVCKKTA